MFPASLMFSRMFTIMVLAWKVWEIDWLRSGKGPVFRNRFFALLGNGIFNTGTIIAGLNFLVVIYFVDGDMWTHHRKTSANLFSIKKFKTAVLETCEFIMLYNLISFFVVNEHCDKLVKLIDGKGGDAFDIQVYLTVLSLLMTLMCRI